MTAALWEAFTERVAILEHDGGLDRRAATIRAFELCFPGDFRECMKTAAGQPDGETALYEFLEDLIKTGPQTPEEGPIMDANAKNVLNCGEATDGPPQGRETTAGARDTAYRL
jgi:hypothetical protein